MLPLSAASTSFQNLKDQAIAAAISDIQWLLVLGLDVEVRNTCSVLICKLFSLKKLIQDKKPIGLASHVNHSKTPPPRIAVPPIRKMEIEECVCSPWY